MLTDIGFAAVVLMTVLPEVSSPARLSSKVSSLIAVTLYFQNTLLSAPLTVTDTPVGAEILGANVGSVIVQALWSVRVISLTP